MSPSSSRDAASRAEARRRARLQSRGIEVEPYEQEEQPAPAQRSAQPSLIDRLFPPAAPLPGRPDPLAGYHYSGPLRPVVTTWYLLMRNPLVWIAMGVAWAITYFLQIVFGSSALGIVASMLSFVVLIAAGWLGWQRPWAYGLAASIVGFLLYAIFLLLNLLRIPADGPVFNTGEFVVYVLSYLVLQAVIGVVAGFYGGYLRRRLAEPRPDQRNRRRR